MGILGSGGFAAELAARFDEVEHAAIASDFSFMTWGKQLLKHYRGEWEQTCGQIAQSRPEAAETAASGFDPAIDMLMRNTGAGDGNGVGGATPWQQVKDNIEEWRGDGKNNFQDYVFALGSSMRYQLAMAAALQILLTTHAAQVGTAQEELLNICEEAIEALKLRRAAKKAAKKSILEHVLAGLGQGSGFQGMVKSLPAAWSIPGWGQAVAFIGGIGAYYLSVDPKVAGKNEREILESMSKAFGKVVDQSREDQSKLRQAMEVLQANNFTFTAGSSPVLAPAVSWSGAPASTPYQIRQIPPKPKLHTLADWMKAEKEPAPVPIPDPQPPADPTLFTHEGFEIPTR